MRVRGNGNTKILNNTKHIYTFFDTFFAMSIKHIKMAETIKDCREKKENRSREEPKISQDETKSKRKRFKGEKIRVEWGAVMLSDRCNPRSHCSDSITQD